jgi:hypothetical protein
MAVTRLTTNGLTGTKYDIASADNYYMEPIATVMGTGSSGTITFSNIPQGYKHLQIRAIGRTDFAAGNIQIIARFNGDTTTNYSTHNLYGIGSGTGTFSGNANVTYTEVGQFAGSTNSSGIMGIAVVDILDYSNVNKFKTTRSLSGNDGNGTGIIILSSGLWMNTAAITSMVILAGAGSFLTTSRFSLYGIKG